MSVDSKKNFSSDEKKNWNPASKPGFDPEFRKTLVPVLEYPDDLPVVQKRHDIARAILEHPVLIISGETGSGKTTQLPKICLEVGRGLKGWIGHTQPRRIAARTVAQRIAEELNQPLGQSVGYKIRFNDVTRPQSLIKLMTDGILLAETQSDPELRQYDTIIIDEAHERSLNIDFLLGYLKKLLPRRPDLKLIITSATIDPERFSRHFDNAPMIEVTGRTYPVSVLYRPLSVDERVVEDSSIASGTDDADLTEIEGIHHAVQELWSLPSGPGDTLVFLPTERDIRETAEALEKAGLSADILPLFSRLSLAEQMRVFHPDGKRHRIILSTNVAETSVTVPGIRYVVDVGLARISRYSARTRVQRLPIEPISMASADQRKGRCGRVSEGVCVRLYSEKDYLERPRFTDPEILRTNLASVILQMKWLRLGKVEEFPFIDPPDYRQVRDGLATLHELGAIDDKENLTPIGRRLARLPLDPRIGRMIVAAQDENCLESVLVIAAALSVSDVRERPLEAQEAADQAHMKFRDEQSDFISLLRLWQAMHRQQAQLSNNQFRKWCRAHFLSYMRYREWVDIHQQLCQMLQVRSWEDRSGSIRPVVRQDEEPVSQAERDRIHRALLTGLLSHLGVKTDATGYMGARGMKMHLWPGSAMFKVRPAWVMAAELVETTRLYARTVGPVRVEWIERAASHLLKRSYSDPHWHSATASVRAYEKVTLFGLVLIDRRATHLGPIDPVTSRQLFIQHALVENDFRTDHPALLKNRERLRMIEAWQRKLRRQDLLTDAGTRFAFFDAKIPKYVFSGSTFDKWARRGQGSNWHELELGDAELFRGIDPVRPRPDVEVSVHPPPTGASVESWPGLKTMAQASEWIQSSFPDTWEVEGMKLPLDYKYEPGEDDDGITVKVPVNALSQIPDSRAEWLVPGMVREKIDALIRSLPKKLRTLFVPVNETAERVEKTLKGFGIGSLVDQVAGALWKISGQPVRREDFQQESIPPYLRMNFRVMGNQSEVLAESRDLMQLRAKLGQKIRQAFSTLPDPRYTRDELKQWDFPDLPEQVTVEHAGAILQGYPTLIDHGTSVSLRLLDSAETSAALMPGGLRRLFMVQTSRELRQVLRDLPGLEQLKLNYHPFGSGEELMEDLMALTADRSFFAGSPAVRTRSDFAHQAGEAWKRLFEVSRSLGRLLGDILDWYRRIEPVLRRDYPPLLIESIDDMRRQLRMLLPRRFLTVLPPDKLELLPKYLRGIDLRLVRLTNAGLARDLNGLSVIRPLMQQYLDRQKKQAQRGLIDPTLEEYRWLLEEFRIQLFAQELRTTVPVSAKRLEQVWQRVKQV